MKMSSRTRWCKKEQCKKEQCKKWCKGLCKKKWCKGLRQSCCRTLFRALIMLGVSGVTALPASAANASETATAIETTTAFETTAAVESAEARGQLQLRLQDGSQHPALLQHTEVRFEIAGMLVRSHIVQTFKNTAAGWAEGIYSFPLPEQAAVDHLRMRVGERLIEGQVQPRRQARATYDQARQQGQRASLVEQQRANIFTTSVANIGPGDEIRIEIEYQQLARFDSGRLRLRFPLVVAPRYIPGQPLASRSTAAEQPALHIHSVIEAGPLGWSQPTDQVPDADRITPPVALPGEHLAHRVAITAAINAGFPLAEISSSYHPIIVNRLSRSEATLRLSEGPVPADRDFELVWTPEASAVPQAALLTDQRAEGEYGLLMILPPRQPRVAGENPGDGGRAATALPKSQTLVLDISGSMHGDSIEQAKLSIDRAIDRLAADDRFNLIVFNNRTDSLFTEPRPATQENRARARRYLRALEADGGTEMAGALEHALRQSQPPGYVQQLLFITDGAVGNEAALLQRISTGLQGQRLFTVGIGSAPNSHFMTKAAQLGKGTFTYIGDVQEVQAKMDTLLDKLSAPQLTDIRLRGAVLDSYPTQIPDLYQGEPLLLSFRAEHLPAEITVQGRLGGRPWQQRVALKQGAANPAVAVLWARRRIDALMDQHRLSAQLPQRDALEQQITATALSHHLVSRFTSLVAVDVTPVRPASAGLRTQAVKTQLPQGWSHDKVFAVARTATAAPLQLLTGLLLLLLALLIYRPRWRPAAPAWLRMPAR